MIFSTISHSRLIERIRSFEEEVRGVYDSIFRNHKEQPRDSLSNIYRLAMAAEMRNNQNGDHLCRMSYYSAQVAKMIGFSKRDVKRMFLASPIHDIGKIGVSETIWLKPSQLTRAEFTRVKTHTIIGSRLLKHSDNSLVRMARTIAHSHHENYDGSGYPQGLKGKKIPIAAQIVRVTDIFDALTSKRPYKDAYLYDFAFELMKRERGKIFNGDIIDMFHNNIDKIYDIYTLFYPIRAKEDSSFRLSERDGGS